MAGLASHDLDRFCPSSAADILGDANSSFKNLASERAGDSPVKDPVPSDFHQTDLEILPAGREGSATGKALGTPASQSAEQLAERTATDAAVQLAEPTAEETDTDAAVPIAFI